MAALQDKEGCAGSSLRGKCPRADLVRRKVAFSSETCYRLERSKPGLGPRGIPFGSQASAKPYFIGGVMKKLQLSSMCICLLIVIGFAAQGFTLELGDNKFVFIGYVSGDAKSGDYTIKADPTDREFRLSAGQLKNYKALRTSLARAAQAGEHNKCIRFSGRWAGNGRQLDAANLQVEIIEGERDCPHKIYSTRTINGVYEGTEWGDFGHVTIREANGTSIDMFGDGDEVFGEKTGIRVQASVTTAQDWLDTGDWGMCVIADFLESGKRLN